MRRELATLGFLWGVNNKLSIKLCEGSRRRDFFLFCRSGFFSQRFILNLNYRRLRRPGCRVSVVVVSAVASASRAPHVSAVALSSLSVGPSAVPAVA